MCHAYCCHPVACALLTSCCLLRRGGRRRGHHARPRGRGGRGGGPGAALLPQRQQVGIGAPAQLQEGAACICPWPLQPADTRCQAVVLCSTYDVTCTPSWGADEMVALDNAASWRHTWPCGSSRSLRGSGRATARPPAATMPPAPSSRCVIILLHVPWRCQKSQPQLVRGHCCPPAATAASSVLRSARTPDPE
jgi:hypothetical protein